MGTECVRSKPEGPNQCDCPICREMRIKWRERGYNLVTSHPDSCSGPGGSRGNQKVRFADMISDFHLALQSVASVTAMGVGKHGPLGGWRQVPGFKEEYQNKKARHAIAGLVDDGGLDPESGLPHLAHEAWNALALLQFALESEARVESGQP